MTMAMPHISELSSNWWALALRGALAILFGLVTFTMPGLTLAAIIALIGVFFLVEGVLAIMAAIRGMREHDRWGWMLMEGIVSIVAGLIAFLLPSTGLVALVWLIAAWAILTGALEIAAAIRLRKIITNEWTMIVAGVLAILLGIFVASRPGLALALLVTWIGVYALFWGVVTLMLAFRVRKWTHEHA
jgi:uncharacterized membrane protein HdeD (DUF308 family)